MPRDGGAGTPRERAKDLLGLNGHPAHSAGSKKRGRVGSSSRWAEEGSFESVEALLIRSRRSLEGFRTSLFSLMSSIAPNDAAQTTTPDGQLRSACDDSAWDGLGDGERRATKAEADLPPWFWAGIARLRRTRGESDCEPASSDRSSDRLTTDTIDRGAACTADGGADQEEGLPDWFLTAVAVHRDRLEKQCERLQDRGGEPRTLLSTHDSKAYDSTDVGRGAAAEASASTQAASWSIFSCWLSCLPKEQVARSSQTDDRAADDLDASMDEIVWDSPRAAREIIGGWRHIDAGGVRLERDDEGSSGMDDDQSEMGWRGERGASAATHGRGGGGASLVLTWPLRVLNVSTSPSRSHI